MAKSKMFGAAEPDTGAAEPAAQDPNPSDPTPGEQATPPGDPGQGDRQPIDGQGQGQVPEDPLSQFSTNEEVAQYIRDLEARVVAQGEALRTNTQQQTKDQILGVQPQMQAPQIDPIDQQITGIFDKIKEEDGPDAAERFRDLTILVAKKVSEPLERKVKELEFDSQWDRVRQLYPNVDQHIDQLVAKAREPGYSDVKIVDLCAMVLGPPRQQIQPGQAVPGVPQPGLQPRNPFGQHQLTNADQLALKRDAHIDGGGGSGALPEKALSDAKATELLERHLGLQPGDAATNAQRGFWGVR